MAGRKIERKPSCSLLDINLQASCDLSSCSLGHQIRMKCLLQQTREFVSTDKTTRRCGTIIHGGV